MTEVNVKRFSADDAMLQIPPWFYSNKKEESGWRRGICFIKDLAQDQKIFGIPRGRSMEIYRALKTSSVDPQSDIAEALLMPGQDEAANALLELYEFLVHHKRTEEDSLIEQEPLLDLGRPLLEMESNDEPTIADDNAPEWTPEHLTDEILNSDAVSDWPHLRDLTLLAEDTGFTPEQNARLAPRLLDLAIHHRDSNDSQDQPIVWSAIRTGASMLRPNEAGRLRLLLEPGHPIETSLVAVKMLGRIFEAQPPGAVDRYPELAAEVSQIAKSLLNRYAIASSQSAAMAQLSIYALAAMASSDTIGIVNTVRSLGQSWFAKQTSHELRELREYWNSQPTEVANGPCELLEQAIQELNAD